MNNINKTNNFPLENKTIYMLRLEIKDKAKHFIKKYEESLNNKQYSQSMVLFYRNTKNKYIEFNELLYHIDKYGSIICGSKCLSCCIDKVHIKRLSENFNKYKNIIIKCKDGWRFNKK